MKNLSDTCPGFNFDFIPFNSNLHRDLGAMAEAVMEVVWAGFINFNSVGYLRS